MKKTVLVVDDEKDLVDLLDYNLSQAGFRVQTAMDGATAVASIRRERPDLVLLDVMMPELSGIEVLKLLRSDAGALESFEAEAKLRQGQLLVNQSRYCEALPLLKRAQELKPRDDVARYLEQVERVARARR